MKKGKSLLAVLGMLLVLLVMVPVHAAENAGNTTETAGTANKETTVTAVKKSGLVKEGRYYRYYRKGVRCKNKWKRINGRRYFFNEKGNAATYSLRRGNYVYVFDTKGRLVQPSRPGVKSVGKYSYYVNTKGQASTGWMVVKDRLYYADAKGRLYKNRTREGVTFTKYGYAADDTASRLKKTTMSIVSRITNSRMTQYQKLRACWNYVLGHVNYCSYYPSGRTGWQRELAYLALVQGGGNCYGFACAFAALAREVGYDPYLVCGRVSGTRDGASDGMTRHCWVSINGAYYDPEGQYAGWFTGVYGSGSYDIAHTVQSYVRYAG